jgi:hypothetical protein
MFFLLGCRSGVQPVEKSRIEIKTLFQGLTLSILFPSSFQDF